MCFLTSVVYSSRRWILTNREKAVMRVTAAAEAVRENWGPLNNIASKPRRIIVTNVNRSFHS